MLIAFKEEFGHCSISQRCANNPSLDWDCGVATREEHTRKSKRESQGRIERVEEIGSQRKLERLTKGQLKYHDTEDNEVQLKATNQYKIRIKTRICTNAA